MTGEWAWTTEARFESRLGAHLPLLNEVLAHLAQLGWDGRDYFGVQMTLEETLTNAIRHGNGSDPEKKVQVLCRVSAERFWMSVEDEGHGFIPTEVADCTADENLEALGGRGMLLIRAYMEEVSFNERGNRITVATQRGYRPPPTEDE
ncbi:ATP-binding protein [Botrimarina hoheduenensis]|uniref:Anti-sigma F factor n=1 Tax=Botrimarina hoheduenensis TaxID=2528000 RepID=A0A5C5WC28_9BACT|nr:ATP-binding protein [Botrimarina hoheduenensis]TWT48458.1 anti-sigma F factor [Botrimarina hoheduenensis]